jgi:hypothetical protein
LASGSAEGIGLGAGHIHIEHGEGVAPSEMPIDLLDHRTALKEHVGRMQRKEGGPEVHDIGHQLVLADSASVKPNG